MQCGRLKPRRAALHPRGATAAAQTGGPGANGTPRDKGRATGSRNPHHERLKRPLGVCLCVVQPHHPRVRADGKDQALLVKRRHGLRRRGQDRLADGGAQVPEAHGPVLGLFDCVLVSFEQGGSGRGRWRVVAEGGTQGCCLGLRRARGRNPRAAAPSRAHAPGGRRPTWPAERKVSFLGHMSTHVTRAW